MAIQRWRSTFVWSVPAYENVICNGVPRVVNANKEERQRGGGKEEQGWPRMRPSHVCRNGQNSIRRKRKRNVKQPVRVAASRLVDSSYINARDSQTSPSLQLFGVPGPLHFDFCSGAINLMKIVGSEFD
ncbi:MAG: hypothetical protein QOH70_208 [Blastocatellia bacterium]|nr:hypothetical protein [Blastocatellia bacterium]